MALVFIISSVVNDCATSLLFSCTFMLSYFFRLPVCLWFVDIALDEIKQLPNSYFLETKDSSDTNVIMLHFCSNFLTLSDGLHFIYVLAVPAYYALILRSLTVLEVLALNADPNFKVLAASYPYFAKRLLTDPNPYLRDALVELLFKDGKFRHELCCFLNFIFHSFK